MHTLHILAKIWAHLSGFLEHLAWPTLAAAVIWYFRNALGALLNRAFSVKALGIEVLTGSTGDILSAHSLLEDIGQFLPAGSWTHEVQASVNAVVFDPKKAGNIYFFSHDLMLCYCALITGCDSSIITHTLACTVDHVQKFGLKDTIFHQALGKMLQSARATKEADWTPQRRRQEARKLWLIARDIGNLLEHAFPMQG